MSFFVFLLGLLVGSFLNAVIWRLYSGRSILEKNSRCPHCGHPLGVADLIPVISFFLLRKKCRYCAKPISWQYPLVELATGIAFVLVYRLQGLSFTTYYLLLTTCFLIVIFVYDLKHYLILDRVVWPAALLAFLYQGYRGNWGSALLGAGLLAGFFALLFFVSRGKWIGAGDVKLGIFLGLLVPFPATLALFFLAYLMGALFSLVFLVLRRKKMSDRLPFGTFLTLAAFIAMLKGEEIMQWYFTLIGLQ